MPNRLLAAASLVCAALLAPLPAAAAIYTVTYNGTITDGSATPGAFGVADGVLTGLDYEAVFRIDTTKGLISDSADGSSSYLEGPTINPPVKSIPVTATLSINGESVFFGTGFGRDVLFDYSGCGCIYAQGFYRWAGNEGGVEDDSGVTYTSGLLNIDGTSTTPFFSDFSHTTLLRGGDPLIDFLSGTFTYGYYRRDFETGAEKAFVANGRLSVASSSIGVPVPEPASWGLMILGFGAAGAALRRRRGIAWA